MGRLIDDEVKQKLLNSLAEEPTMVLSTAYAYAKNYVMYGEDITKAWTTAVQQASMIENVSLNARVQAYETFKRDYENRLKADMVEMLTDLSKKVDASPINPKASEAFKLGQATAFDRCESLIRWKINELKGDLEGKE